MPIHLRYESPTGETRPWTFKEIVQGRPIGHPTHPMLIHFPVAFYLAVVIFDVMTRITPTPGLVLAGTYLLLFAFLASAGAVATGLVDWFGMISGSSKKRLATNHMILQLITAAIFVTIFILRWSSRNQDQAELLWIVLGVIGYGILVVGQYLGGVLVYERAMRVSTGGATD